LRWFFSWSRAVALLEDAAQRGERASVARLDLDQHLVEKAAPQLRAGLDQAEVVRPEERDPEVARQVERAPPCPIDLDGAFRALALDVKRDRQLAGQRTVLDRCLDSRARSDRAHELGLATRPRRGRERQHGDCFEQVRLALPVGADEHVDVGSRREVELGVVAMVLQLEPEKAH